MKFAFYVGFAEKIQELGPAGAAEYALRLGFSGTELLASVQGGADSLPDMATARELHRALKERGLPMVCCSVYADLWHNPRAEELLLKKAEYTAELECPYLHHTLFPTYHPGESDPSFEEALKKVAESAARIAKHAEKLGVTCLYEDQGAYFNDIPGYGALLQTVKESAPAGVCADFGNILFVNGSPQAFIENFAADVRHVHVKDYLLKNGECSPGMYWLRGSGDLWLRETMVGSGAVDVPACMQALKAAGYDGYYALELCHPEPFEDGVRQAMEYLTRFE
ncbi:MAG: sugar phosphate isomerase/epimerase [Clostridia bacterium]|nr:sugar phosphate isomerase/epimerase [Clostridia bacterium]